VKNIVKLIMVPYINKPPIILITMAAGVIRSQWANMAGSAASSQSLRLFIAYPQNEPIPITTKKPVMNLPKSTTPVPPPSIKSSCVAARLHSQFGTGARM
jgi:hypothetical protein